MARIVSTCVSVAAVIALSGCAQLGQIFHQPGSTALAGVDPPPPEVRLAAYSTQVALADKPIADPPAAEDDAPQDDAAKHETTPDEMAATSPEKKNKKKKKKKPYTPPGAAYRQLSIGQAITMAAVAMPGILGGGQEASQTLVIAPEGIVGRTGLTAPSTLAVNNVIIGRPGLQENAIRGLGFASPQANIFRPQRNPLTGPNGVCGELVQAGFYRNAAACRAQFKH